MVQTDINVKSMSPEQRIKWLQAMERERAKKLEKLKKEEEKVKKELELLTKEEEEKQKDIVEAEKLITESLDEIAFEEVKKRREQQERQLRDIREKEHKEEEEAQERERELSELMQGEGLESKVAGARQEQKPGSELEKQSAYANPLSKNDSSVNPYELRGDQDVYNNIMDLTGKDGAFTKDEYNRVQSYKNLFEGTPEDAYKDVKKALGMSEDDAESEVYRSAR